MSSYISIDFVNFSIIERDRGLNFELIITKIGQRKENLLGKSDDFVLQRKDRGCTIENGIADEESTMIEDIIAPGK